MPLVRLPGVFRPVRDADLLIEALRRERLTAATTVADLCTGTGVVAVAAARTGASVTAIDVSRRALLCARVNGLLAGARIETVRGDLFAALSGRRVDVITVNPPYLPAPDREARAPRGAARAWEGGADGRALIARICAGAADHLRPGGTLLMVHSSIIGVQRTLDALRAGRLDAEVVARHRGPVGPLVLARAGELRARGYLQPGQSDEDLVVLRGQVPAARRSARRADDLREAARASEA